MLADFVFHVLSNWQMVHLPKEAFQMYWMFNYAVFYSIASCFYIGLLINFVS